MELNEKEINALWKETKKDVAVDYLNQKSNQNRLTDDEIQKMFQEHDDQKTLRGKLTKLRKNFVQSLNPKYIKEQRAKRRAEDEQYKAELKAHYGLSDAEVRKSLREFNYQNSCLGRAVDKLSNFGQEIKFRYFPPKSSTNRLTNAEIEALLAEHPSRSTNAEKSQPEREM